MTFTTLIDTDQLAARLADTSVCLVDCRFSLDDTSWGARQYEAAHIPSAAFADLNRDLSSSPSGQNGRHPLPDPTTLALTFGRLGIAPGVQVVAYDQDNGMYASRLWWLLRWMGHDAVAVLDGGLSRWTREARPTASGIETHTAAAFTGTPRPGMVISVSEAAALSLDPAYTLIDARAPERYRGDVEPLDRVAGHIPGASNHFFKNNLTDAGTFRTPAELAAALAPALGGRPADHVVCYCGSGVTACHNLLALEHAGITGARLYAGSWSEWSSDPTRPIERTPATTQS